MENRATESSVATLPLPPGSMGLPLLGETLALLKNPYHFLEERRAKHGKVFKSHALGRRVVFVSGPDAMTAFLDTNNVSRVGAHPAHVRALFGGINMNMFDGPKHFALKSMALEGFNPAAIAGYLPDMQRLIEQTLDRLGTLPVFAAVREMNRLVIELICKNVMGLAPGPVTDGLRQDYFLVMEGIMNVPIPLPGTTFSRAKAARDRIFKVFRSTIAEHRATPSDDGLGRMLAARMPDGQAYSDEEALLELHHIIIAGYIVYALFTTLMQRMTEAPALQARLRSEVKSQAGQGALTIAVLESLRQCGHAVLETKRTAPILPLLFGKAVRDFAINGVRIPAGWDVYMALSLSNTDASVWSAPERFDEARFSDARAEHSRHEHAFIPQGGGARTGHKCLGLDYSTYAALTFLVVLLRRWNWEIPPQDLTYLWKRTPPEPRDGLQMTLRKTAD